MLFCVCTVWGVRVYLIKFFCLWIIKFLKFKALIFFGCPRRPDQLDLRKQPLFHAYPSSITIIPLLSFFSPKFLVTLLCDLAQSNGLIQYAHILEIALRSPQIAHMSSKLFKMPRLHYWVVSRFYHDSFGIMF